jgi:hypothetical protein
VAAIGCAALASIEKGGHCDSVPDWPGSNVINAIQSDARDSQAIAAAGWNTIGVYWLRRSQTAIEPYSLVGQDVSEVPEDKGMEDENRRAQAHVGYRCAAKEKRL